MFYKAESDNSYIITSPVEKPSGQGDWTSIQFTNKFKPVNCLLSTSILLSLETHIYINPIYKDYFCPKQLIVWNEINGYPGMAYVVTVGSEQVNGSMRDYVEIPTDETESYYTFLAPVEKCSQLTIDTNNTIKDTLVVSSAMSFDAPIKTGDSLSLKSNGVWLRLDNISVSNIQSDSEYYKFTIDISSLSLSSAPTEAWVLKSRLSVSASSASGNSDIIISDLHIPIETHDETSATTQALNISPLMKQSLLNTKSIYIQGESNEISLSYSPIFSSYTFPVHTYLNSSSGSVADGYSPTICYREVDHKIYIFFGHEYILQMYNPETGSISEISTTGLPSTNPNSYSYTTGCYDPDHDCFYAYGNDMDKLYKYDFNSQSWSVALNNSVSSEIGYRHNHCMEYYNGYVYIWGGWNNITSGTDSKLAKINIKNINSDIDVFDPTVYPPGRVYAASWVYNNRMYIFGGCKYGQEFIKYNDLWYFDFETTDWHYVEITSPWPEPVSAASMYCHKGKILHVSGIGNLHMWLYDIISNKWTSWTTSNITGYSWTIPQHADCAVDSFGNAYFICAGSQSGQIRISKLTPIKEKFTFPSSSYIHSLLNTNANIHILPTHNVNLNLNSVDWAYDKNNVIITATYPEISLTASKLQCKWEPAAPHEINLDIETVVKYLDQG